MNRREREVLLLLITMMKREDMRIITLYINGSTI